MAARLCVECSTPFHPRTPRQYRCPAHHHAQQARRDAARGTTAQRGYGHPHRADKARKLPAAIGTPCPLCGHTMTQAQADAGQLNRHHEVPVAHGGKDTSEGVIAHSWCDYRAGATTRRPR